MLIRIVATIVAIVSAVPNLPEMTPCEKMTQEHHDLNLHTLYTHVREPDEWRGGNMSEVIKELLKELPFDKPD